VSPSDTPVLSLAKVTKTFPGVRALSEVSIDLYPGKVTALVGENGAGKSTVVKTLTGIYQPDGGAILVDGAPVQFPAPQSAENAGVTAIHQETVLFDELSVAENIFLGHAPKGSFGLIDTRAMFTGAKEILDGLGAKIDPNATLKELGTANKHLVAIARALSVDARVVIMDEPTAALSHAEIEELYELVDGLKAQGKAILFISHKFDEIFRIADNYTVFRDGQLIGDGAISDVNEAELVKMMVGRDVSQIFPERDRNLGADVLTVSGYDHPTEFANIGFTLRRGEILGFYGLVGAGRSEFMQALFGTTGRGYDPFTSRCGVPWHCLRARRSRQTGRDRRSANLPKRDPAVAETNLPQGFFKDGGGIQTGAGIH
jgi:rhamnose transport system ATP-binding protein